MSDTPSETPLYDLLRRVPADARAVYENNPTDYTFIQYGSYCQRAADEIERLQHDLSVALGRASFAETRIEELEKENETLTDILDNSGRVVINREQIDAAWEWIDQVNDPSIIELVLGNLNIHRCETCPWHQPVPDVCPNCHGHGWVVRDA